MSDSDIGKTFPFAQATTAGLPAASIASKTAGSSRDCGVGRNWLSITTATLRRAGEQLGEARPGDRRLERRARRLGGVADRLGLVGVDRREQVRVRHLEVELLAVDLRLVAGGADRQRVERFVRDLEARATAPEAIPSRDHARHPDQPRLDRRRTRSTSPPASTRSSSGWSGCRPRSSPSRCSGCALGDDQLHLFESDEDAPTPRHHVSFDVDDFDAVYAKAKEMGILDSQRLRLAAPRPPGRLGAALPPRPGRQPARGRLAGREHARARRPCADVDASSASAGGRRGDARRSTPRYRLKRGKAAC